jgi:hypothetical protein
VYNSISLFIRSQPLGGNILIKKQKIYPNAPNLSNKACGCKIFKCPYSLYVFLPILKKKLPHFLKTGQPKGD